MLPENETKNEIFDSKDFSTPKPRVMGSHRLNKRDFQNTLLLEKELEDITRLTSTASRRNYMSHGNNFPY